MADNNPTGINELEEKKWLISRIDLYHKTVIEIFDNGSKKYENVGNEINTRIKSQRNIILSILGIALTIILGYISAYKIDQIQFYYIVSGLGIVALLVFLFYNWLMKIFEDVFASISNIMTESITRITYSQAYMTTSVLHLSTTKIQFLDNYSIFTTLLVLANMEEIAKLLKLTAKRYKHIPKIQSILTNESKAYNLEFEYKEKTLQSLNRSENMPVELLDFIDKTFASKISNKK